METEGSLPRSKVTELLNNPNMNFQGIGYQDRVGYFWSKMVSSGEFL